MESKQLNNREVIFVQEIRSSGAKEGEPGSGISVIKKMVQQWTADQHQNYE